MSAERRDSYPHNEDIPTQWVQFQHGRRPRMKHTHSNCQRYVGEPTLLMLFRAFAGWRQGTVRPRLLQALSGLGAASQQGSSAELDTLIRWRGWSTRRALSLVNQWREVIAEEEEIWGSAYIARCPAHSGGLWWDLAGIAALCSCSTTAKPLVRLYSTARTNGCNTTLFTLYYIIDTLFSYFDIVQLLWHNLYC